MKYKLLFSFFLTSCIAVTAQSTCEDAFSAANYSVAHATNAYEAYNAVHVQEWAAKAMETFREVEDITSNCGCDDVSNLAYEGYEASEKSQYENTWERSRFFAKRAREKSILMMEALALCTNSEVLDIQNDNSNEYTSNDNNIDDYTSKSTLEEEKEIEFNKQLEIKVKADEALAQINTGFQTLANALGCDAAFEMARNSYQLTKQQLDGSSLSDTKLHYTQKLHEIAEKAMTDFGQCSGNY